MKCITIKQPFANLIVSGEKTLEIRSWKTNFRGRVYIHAASKNYVGYDHLDYIHSAIIGYVDIVDCAEFLPNQEKFAHISHIADSFAWHLSNPVKIEPIFTKGQLGFWSYPQKTKTAVLQSVLDDFLIS